MKLNKLVHRLEDVLESYSTAITTSLHDSKGSYQLSLLHEATRQERKHCPKQLRRRSRHRFTTVTAAVKCHDLHLLDSRSCSRRFVQCALWLLQNAAPTPLGTHEHSRVRFFDPNPRARTAARQSSSGSGNRGRILPRQILFVKCAFYSGPVADLGGDPFPRCGLH